MGPYDVSLLAEILSICKFGVGCFCGFAFLFFAQNGKW